MGAQVLLRSLLGLLNRQPELSQVDGPEGQLAVGPDRALWTRGALSTDFVTGQGTATGTAAPLIATWSTSQTWAQGTVVWAPASFGLGGSTVSGAFLICSTAGAGATTGAGPALQPGQTGIADGAGAAWDWLTDWFRGGVMIRNTDGTNVLTYGSRSYVTSGLGMPLAAGGAADVLPRADPRKIFVVGSATYGWSAWL